MKPEPFTWGIEALDTLLRSALTPGSSILLAGNPGTGKTTLAATICYKNALRGKPCLYTTFHEEKERFVNLMRKFGMDFEQLERQGLFRFFRLPLVSDEGMVSDIVVSITELAEKQGAKVVIVDSFTPLGKAVNGDIRARTLLQNFFYNLARAIDGIVVLIAEVPLGQETIALGDVEFVTDTVIILKHRIAKGMIVRTLEIRKSRGAPLTLVEIPFSIVDNRGIVVHVPPLINELKPPRMEVRIKLPCKALTEAIDHLHPGHYVYIVTPPDARSYKYIMLLITATILANNLRTLIVSYHWSPEEYAEALRSISKRVLQHDIEHSSDVLAKLRRLIAIESLNPAAMSLEELYSRELTRVEEYRPQMVIFDRVDVVSSIHGIRDYEKYFAYLRNELLYFRQLGVLTVRLSALVDKGIYRREASIADAVLKLEYRRKGTTLVPYLYAWRCGREPRTLNPEDLHACLVEAKTLFSGVENG